MKITHKNQPKLFTYPSYKYFNNDSFREALLQKECNENNWDEIVQVFIFSCNIILNKQAPQKKKYVRGNDDYVLNMTVEFVMMISRR